MSLDLKTLELPITRILTAPGTDLSTISAKRVRKALLGDPQYAHLGLTAEVLKKRRAEVDQVIGRIFDEVNQLASSAGSKRKREEKNVNGVADADAGDGGGEGDGDGDGDGQPSAATNGDESDAPVNKSHKKKKGKKSVEESDAALARKLSSEINSRSRRGASSNAAAPSPRKAKRKTKKSPEMLESEDEDEDGVAKPKKRSAAKGGFAKEYTLSAPLSAVLAVEKLSRPQVVKKLWEYIRQHELQNPSNKKEIMCDDALRAVFAVDKIDMFRMNKVLGQHLHEE